MLQLGKSNFFKGFPGGASDKEPACQQCSRHKRCRLGRSPGEGHGNPLQYSCLESPTDRGAWRVLVHGGHEESDTTEPLTLSFSIFSTNGAGATRCQYASE